MGRNIREEVFVENKYLDRAREQQAIEKNRSFQLMFALKNICGKGMNLFGNEEFKRTVQITLERYGYPSKLNIDQLDLDILSRANMNLNNGKSELLSDYIANSEQPADATVMLVNRVREQAINSARNDGYNEQMASKYITTDVVSQFEKTIKEEIDKQEEMENE